MRSGEQSARKTTEMFEVRYSRCTVNKAFGEHGSLIPLKSWHSAPFDRLQLVGGPTTNHVGDP